MFSPFLDWFLPCPSPRKLYFTSPNLCFNVPSPTHLLPFPALKFPYTGALSLQRTKGLSSFRTFLLIFLCFFLRQTTYFVNGLSFLMLYMMGELNLGNKVLSPYLVTSICEVHGKYQLSHPVLQPCFKTPDAGPLLKSWDELASTPITREKTTPDANCKKFYYQLAEDRTPSTMQGRGVRPQAVTVGGF